MNGKSQRIKKIQIKTFPRLHLTLIGMNSDGYRINGGIGFSISSPPLVCSFHSSQSFQIVDDRELKFTNSEKLKLQKILADVKRELHLTKAIQCNISGNVQPHYGLGSSTAIFMSCIEALLLINEVEYDHKTIIFLSKRGGTSGIGINTYMEGGFVFDLGIINHSQYFCPSSVADRNGLLPLVIHKGNSPNWKIGVCIPNFIKSKSEMEEIEFFKLNCPINKVATDEILYEAVFGITAAIMESDYKVFCESVNKIQNTKWKFLERSLYGSELFELEKSIRDFGADCVGMSSLGPTVFFLCQDIERVISQISDSFPNTSCYFTTFNNQGRVIYYD